MGNTSFHPPEETASNTPEDLTNKLEDLIYRVIASQAEPSIPSVSQSDRYDNQFFQEYKL